MDVPVIPGYRDLVKIGGGGMGVVYRATQEALQRTVALKVVRQVEGGPERTRELLKRFDHEIKTSMRLRHPHIVRILDSGRVGGQYFLAMELLEGRRMAPADVGRLLRERAVDGREAAPTTSHEVLLEGLGPGTNYLVYVAHADGSRSVPVAVALPPDAPGLEARVSVERWCRTSSASPKGHPAGSGPRAPRACPTVVGGSRGGASRVGQRPPGPAAAADGPFGASAGGITVDASPPAPATSGATKVVPVARPGRRALRPLAPGVVAGIRRTAGKRPRGHVTGRPPRPASRRGAARPTGGDGVAVRRPQRR